MAYSLNNTNAKRIATINGPIGSGKQNLAELITLTYKNPRIMKMSPDIIHQFYKTVKEGNPEKYGKFILRQCEKIEKAVCQYLKEDKNDILVIVTDITALVTVLAQQSVYPVIPLQYMSQLVQKNYQYQELLKYKAIHTAVFSTVAPLVALDKINQEKREIPFSFYNLTQIREQIASYDTLHENQLKKFNYIDKDGNTFEEKRKKIKTFNGSNLNFYIYRF